MQYLRYMKKAVFRVLASLNRLLLPKVYKFNLERMTKPQKALVAYKYWVLLNALD